jgi:hypothetical protein
VNSRLQRTYYVLKTNGDTAVGLVSLVEHMVQTTVMEFSLSQPEREGTDHEFVDLTFTPLDLAEFETHRDAFQTHVELDVVGKWPSGNGIMSIIVQKKEKTDEKS